MVWKAPATDEERRRWLKRKRHPLCPECGHDLLATLMEGLSRCPECGSEFEQDEIKIGWAPGDWTDRTGWKKGALELAWRTPIAFAVWLGVVWAIAWDLEQAEIIDKPILLHLLSVIGPPVVATGLPIVAGIIVGKLMAWRLAERIGAAGSMLMVLVIIGSLLAIIAGTGIAQILWPTDIVILIFLDLIGVGFSTAAAARSLLAQD